MRLCLSSVVGLLKSCARHGLRENHPTLPCMSETQNALLSLIEIKFFSLSVFSLLHRHVPLPTLQTNECSVSFAFFTCFQGFDLLFELMIRWPTCVRHNGRPQANKKVHQHDFQLKSNDILLSRFWSACAEGSLRFPSLM